MSRRLRTALVIGCLGAGLLHLPRATSCVRAGLSGPYPASVAYQGTLEGSLRTAQDDWAEETRGDGLGT
jgi:hypothetical protein